MKIPNPEALWDLEKVAKTLNPGSLRGWAGFENPKPQEPRRQAWKTPRLGRFLRVAGLEIAKPSGFLGVGRLVK